MRRARALSALALLALLACTAPALAQGTEQTATTILLVRHAERAADDPRDPGLSDAGRARARALAEALADAGLAAVYTTQYRRTRETGAAVAERTGAPLIVAPIEGRDIEAYADRLLARIRAEHRGRAVLVVGHSNTVPVIAGRAAGRSLPLLEEHEFDRLFWVALGGDAPTLIRARY